ncbi:insulinoma-associated protein 1-like isoform X2 [Microplitis demolitor]|uniref:insulinoma-associated protein 1-like isoform X2 n=1 Tax=Microplitis demolitor TaxID=69319 RepID=UPI00235B6A4D|nr:insulinoma-associated protein 1-like isoform X2 [Microplitis demolitor]
MLHSALPRSFLPPPGLCYLGGYYGEAVHPYSPVSRFASLENAYLSDHHALAAVEPSRPSLPASPSPLDLSLKPPAPPQTPATDDSETIEVDDIEDRPDYPEDNGYDREKRYHHDWDSRFGIEEQRSPVARAYHFYDELRARPSSQDPVYSDIYQSPSSSPSPSQKLLLTSPSTLRSMQSYQQQLLLTPQHHLQGVHAPMTPPSTPSPPQCPRRRPREDEDTPGSMTSINVTPKSSSADKISRPKKKHARRLKFDEDTSSPVSGTVILGPDEAVVTGDIDPAFNVVEVTEEARAELAKIENRLGPYQCKLCRHLHEDAFQLAQHRCSRIAHVEYRCPECDKRFSCPANLASHRRWHKPRPPADSVASQAASSASAANVSSASMIQEICCNKCDAKFTRQTALRKHLAAQHPEANNNILIVNNNINGSNINNNNNNNNSNNNNIISSSNSNSSSSSNENICMETGSTLASKSLAAMQLASGPLTNEMP